MNMAEAVMKTTTRRSWEGGLDRLARGGRRRRGGWMLVLRRCWRGSVGVLAVPLLLLL